MEESDFYGIGGMTETVCLDHFTDGVLRDALTSEAASLKCSFCGREGAGGDAPFAVEMDELGTLVWDVLTWSYDWTEDPGDPWRDYEIYDNTYVMYETVEEAVDPAYAMQIVECLIRATTSTDSWVPSDSTDPSALGWSAYAATVRTESRFVVIGESKRTGYEDEPPARIGKFLSALLAYVQSDLLIELPPDSTLYRGRMTDNAQKLLDEEVRKEPSTALGSSPSSLAGDNRLSSPGISLFYSADDLHVAVAEIALHSKYDEAVVGAFKTTRVMRLLDFTLPLTKLPSIFAIDEESRQRWMFARFKKHFTDMLTAPVVLDGRENIDYTPTQVVAEWLRWVPEQRIDGIAWPSHLAKKTKPRSSANADAAATSLESTGRNVALFFGHGRDFQTDPPTVAELARPGAHKPNLTLSADDITLHTVSRAVTVAELPTSGDEDDPAPILMGL